VVILVLSSVVTRVVLPLRNLVCFCSCSLGKLPQCWLCNFPGRKEVQSEEVWTALLLLWYAGCRTVHYSWGNGSL